MITSAFVYNGVNLVLAIACLVSVLLVFRYIPDKRARVLLVVAFLLVILNGGISSVCLNVSKYFEVAYAGEALGKAPPGTFDKVNFYKYDLSRFANILELVAVGIMVIVSEKLASLRNSGQKEAEVAE